MTTIDKPYDQIARIGYMLPSGVVASMADVVTIANPDRFLDEVKLIQMALGVEPDGMIGPRTRYAAKAANARRIASWSEL